MSNRKNKQNFRILVLFLLIIALFVINGADVSGTCSDSDSYWGPGGISMSQSGCRWLSNTNRDDPYTPYSIIDGTYYYDYELYTPKGSVQSSLFGALTDHCEGGINGWRIHEYCCGDANNENPNDVGKGIIIWCTDIIPGSMCEDGRCTCPSYSCEYESECDQSGSSICDYDGTVCARSTNGNACTVGGYPGTCTSGVCIKSCDCTTGVCCDGCDYRSTSYLCNDNYQTEYGCPWGTSAGYDVGIRYRDQYCSGTSESCTGSSYWESWTAYDNCDLCEYCTVGDPSCNIYCLGTDTSCGCSSCTNCDNSDGWYDTGSTQWILSYECTEKEQKEQGYRNYYCSAASCIYSTGSIQWVDTGNTRDYCSSDQRCIGEGECVDSCIFTNAYWSQDSAAEGDNIQMIIEGTNCDGKVITFEIWEDDLTSDDFVIAVSGTFDRETWMAQWQDDGIGNPEYYFKAVLDAYTSMTRTSGLLDIGTSCGNGVINGLEECDDGDTISGDGCSDICELERETYWTDRYGEKTGNDIGEGISVNVGSTVKMVLNNSGLGMEEFVTFEIYEGDIINDEEIRTLSKGNTIEGTFEMIGYGLITAEWTITQEDYDAADELFADYDGFVFRINGEESNKLTILPKDYALWCADHDEEASCERCDDYNCDAAANSVNKKIFEAFPDVWGGIKCGNILEKGNCSYIVNCKCIWLPSEGICGYEWELIPYNCIDYPAIGLCLYQEDTSDDCEDGFLTYSWIATWLWGIDNGYSNFNDGPSSVESDYIYNESESKYYYDPGRSSEKCYETSSSIACPAQIQLPFFTWETLLTTIIILGIIYVIWNLKKKKRQRKKRR